MPRNLRQAAASLLTVLPLMLASLPVLACSGAVHIEVGESGVYALDYAAIVAAQPALKDCRAADLALLNRGEEVPVRVVDDGHGGFGPGARIEWLGRMLHGPQSWFDQYSNVNVYQLAATPGPHARLREIDAVPAAGPAVVLHRRLHFEQENLLIRLDGDEMKPGDEPDVWQWAKLTPIDAQPFTFDFDLPDADLARAAPAELRLVFRGESNIPPPAQGAKPADHVVDVAVNGRVVQTLTWDGRAELARTIAVAPSLLKAQHNQLRLRVPRRDLAGGNFIVDVVMFNWMEVTYPVHGDLNAGTASFQAAGSGSMALSRAGVPAPVLFGSDGTYRRAVADRPGHYRAAGADSGVELYPEPTAGPLQPIAVRAVPGRDLRAADVECDYLIVAHPRLLEAIEPLARYHREHGLRVTVADVNDVYDEFGSGIAHPRAIRDFVAYGWTHWQVKPRYLLLVGDASFDIHHDLRSNRPNANQYALRPQPFRHEILNPGLSGMGTTPYRQWDPDLPDRNLIPTWQMPSAEGQFASDNPFVALNPGDIHPQLAVGRLPVIEPDEVQAIVDKTIAYSEHPAFGAWRRDVTFVSTSELAAFKQDSDRMAADLRTRGFSVQSLYTDAHEKDTARYRQARATLRQDLDAGNLLVHFLGHGGQFIWRVGPIGDLFGLDDVSALRNAGRYPMVLAMTCFSAPFDHPTDDSIGERFLREADKGAIAVFAASWTNWPNPAYSRPLIDNLLTPGLPIGDAIVRTKARIDDNIFVEMYNLLGDPAVVLARPRGEMRLARAGDRWDARVIARVPAADFGGTVDVDWLDARGGVIASRHYEARDAMFQLTVPEGAARVAVFAADTRDGSTAIGSLELGGAPKPAAAPAPKPVAAPVVRKPRPKPAVEPRDRIGERDFE